MSRCSADEYEQAIRSHSGSQIRSRPRIVSIRSASEREEKNSVVIASNESFGGWTKTYRLARARALTTI